MQEKVKPWWASKTIWGGIVAAVCGVLALAGHQVSPDTQSFLTQQAVQVATAVATVVGGALAIYGRIKAQGKIGKKSK